ncbi:Uncharacterised protein [Mycobacteroides abscessus]|nr:Uncharacterised protein [Mycobacteroides abscessus]
MRSVAYGTMRIASVTRNSTSRPGNRNRANANPPSSETVSVKSTVSPETTTEFHRYWPMPAW